MQMKHVRLQKGKTGNESKRQKNYLLYHVMNKNYIINFMLTGIVNNIGNEQIFNTLNIKICYNQQICNNP